MWWQWISVFIPPLYPSLLSPFLQLSSPHLLSPMVSLFPQYLSFPSCNISLPRWISIFFYHSTQSKDDDNEEDNSISTPIECYACTQMGVPGFHSTSCDQIHPPEWEACAGSSLIPIKHRPKGQFNKTYRSSDCQVFIRPFGHVLNPRSKNVQRWNRAFILLRGLALAIDPLFFYALSVGRIRTPCLYMDGGLAATVTLLRTSVDAIHLCYLWFQFSLAYVSKESLVVGCGKLVWDAHAIASHYVRSFNGFWFDVFVILPVPQLVFWFVVPKLIKEEKIMLLVTILVLDFAFQYLPKVYHSICLMRRMQKVTGYVFGTIWWGFGLNLIAYLIASHVVGGCWYVLAVQRVASCLRQQCKRNRNCNLSLSCAKEVPYSLFELADTRNGNNFNISMPSMSTCLDGNGPFRYGIYKWALPVVSSNSLAVKIIYPIFWGLVTTCTFGNVLEPTSNSGETIFSSVVTICGLLLFTLLVGNIQVFIHTVMAKKSKMQLKYRDMEWWMRRRQLPSSLKHRVRHFERQRWAAMGGEDEMELIKDLPQGLRRDIKRYICLDLIKKVPLFHSLDDLILDNICDRVKPLVFSKGEKIIREGDPVQRMLFVIRGQLQSKQRLGQGKTATCSLGPGNFLGDELLSWCIRRPFIDRLPASSATFTCLKATEAFGLDANHLHYIIDHFRYKFANERLKRTTRYHSSNWRTWAAANIQFAWRRYKMKTRGHVMQVPINGDSDSGHRLWQCAAIFLSLKPHDHLE